MRIEHRLKASRTDHRLTFSELIEFARWCEESGVTPSDMIKVKTTVTGWLRELEIIPDSEDHDQP